MLKFLIKIVAFLALVAGLFLVPPLTLHNIPYENSIMAVLPDKHKLLQQATSPKIIFVGGSNVSMSLNSKEVSEAYRMPVVNTSIALWLGLKFMLNDLRPYIKKGDIVVIAPEYSSYDNTIDEKGWNGFGELLAVLFEIYPQGRSQLDASQVVHLAKFLPHFTVAEIRSTIAGRSKTDLDDMSVRKSFNEYGDLSAHWQLKKIPFAPEPKCNGTEKINPEAISFLVQYNQFVNSKGAKLVILPPPLQAASFQNQKFIIKKIEAGLRMNNLPLAASPERYIFNDNYCNDAPYHLTKPGVDIRTQLVIQDLAKIVNKSTD